MDRSLLVHSGLMVMLAASQPVHAQYIVAGQAAGATYVDLVPDKVLTARKTGVSNALDSLDLDGDGRFDLRLAAYTNTSRFPSEAETRVLPLHDNVAIYSASQAPFIVGFASNDSIQQRIAQPVTVPPNVWGSRSTIYPYSSSWLTHFGNNPAGFQSYGYWSDGQEHYLAVRLRAGSAAAWRYGWVRLQATNTDDPVSIIIKDYALGSSVLAQQSARAAGWQIYPVPTTQLLTVQSATAATGRLTISDACGRVHFSTPFAGTSQRFDISTLAAGLYMLRLETSTGSFAQRIAKQ